MPSGRYIDVINIRIPNSLFMIDKKGIIRNYFTNKIIPIKIINKIKYVKLGTTFQFKNNIDEYVRVIDLIGLGFKPLNIDSSEYLQVECLPIDGNLNNFNLDNLVWKFPIGGLESIYYPDWYYIPGFTNYLVHYNQDKKLIIMNKKDLHIKSWYRHDNEYLMVSLSSDNSTSIGITMHRIIGLVFLDYPLNAKDLVVDHIDQVRRNNDINNLQWVTLVSNLNKGTEHKESLNTFDKKLLKVNKPIKCLNIFTKEITTYSNIRDILEKINISDWQIRQSIEGFYENRLGIVKNKYIFRLEGDGFPYITEDVIKQHLSYGGQPRPTLLKDISKNEIREFSSAADLYRSMKLSKKTVTRKLRKGEQPIPNTPYLVKYKDSLDDWIY